LPWSFAASRLGTAGLAGLGGRYAHFGALLTSRVRSRILTAALARVRSTGRCSPGPFSPLEHSPAARGFGVRADQRDRDEPAPRLSSRPKHLATCIRQVLNPAVGSRTHGPPTSPVDRTGRRHRQAVNLLASGFAFRSPAVHQPRSSFASGTSRPLALTRTRDVLPAPPLGGAPRLRSFVRADRTRRLAWVDLGDTSFGLLVGRPLAGPAISSGVLPLVEPAREFERTRRAA